MRPLLILKLQEDHNPAINKYYSVVSQLNNLRSPLKATTSHGSFRITLWTNKQTKQVKSANYVHLKYFNNAHFE